MYESALGTGHLVAQVVAGGEQDQRWRDLPLTSLGTLGLLPALVSSAVM